MKADLETFNVPWLVICPVGAKVKLLDVKTVFPVKTRVLRISTVDSAI